jgi:hypothetical protein
LVCWSGFVRGRMAMVRSERAQPNAGAVVWHADEFDASGFEGRLDVE